MQPILNDVLTLTALPWQVVLLRLAGALGLRGLIGLQRETRNRPAGLRTHMLVGLAAAIGLSAGFGFWLMAIAMTLLALAVIWLVKVVEDRAHDSDEDERREI